MLSHAPKDEYETETYNIMKVLAETQDILTLAFEINGIFIESFGDDISSKNMDECTKIAVSIIEKL